MLFSGAVPWQHGGGQRTGFDRQEKRKKKKKGLEKVGHRAKEGRVGAADVIMLFITGKWRRRRKRKRSGGGAPLPEVGGAFLGYS